MTSYFRASNTGSSKFLRAAFHPSAHLQWVEPTGELTIVTQLQWWQRLDAKPAVPTEDRRIEVLDREGPLALVEAVSRWPTHTYDDLLLVVRTPGGWRIVGKVFEELAPGAAAESRPEDDAEIRAVLATKIAAAADHDFALLAQSHTPLCQYYGLADAGGQVALASVSEWGAIYATRRERGETDRAPWRILSIVVRGRMAAAKLDATFEGRRYVDHLLLLRVAEGWRIAAAVWGDPTIQIRTPT